MRVIRREGDAARAALDQERAAVGLLAEEGSAELVEGAVLDLAHALLGDAERYAERFQRLALVLQPPFAHDAKLALVEHAKRGAQPAHAALLVDGGVRTGLDVLRMLALGASAVMLGRPWVFALAGAGEDGVRRLIDLIAAELRIAMALTGCREIAAVDRDVIRERLDDPMMKRRAA